MMDEKFPIVVLISGNGSNLQAIIDNIENKMWDIEIKAVISNNPSAYGLERAAQAGIPTKILPNKDFDSREAFDNALLNIIEQYHPKLIVLAGFMRILSKNFTHHFSGRLINIHPSLLPKYKGLHTHRQALEANDTVHGCTVHLVNEELDAGAIIGQMECEILPDDTEQSLSQKVHKLEHQLFPEIINWIAEGRVKL